MRRLGIGLATVALLLGLKFYNKSKGSTELRTRLTEICANDTGCRQAVQAHFEACFESAYKMGGRHQSSRLATDQLVKCINDRAGKEYFTYDETVK